MATQRVDSRSASAAAAEGSPPSLLEQDHTPEASWADWGALAGGWLTAQTRALVSMAGKMVAAVAATRTTALRRTGVVMLRYQVSSIGTVRLEHLPESDPAYQLSSTCLPAASHDPAGALAHVITTTVCDLIAGTWVFTHRVEHPQPEPAATAAYYKQLDRMVPKGTCDYRLDLFESAFLWTGSWQVLLAAVSSRPPGAYEYEVVSEDGY